MLVQILCQRLHISLVGFSRYKTQAQQTAGGVINKHDQGARLCPAFKPVMRRTINLHQFPETEATHPARMNASFISLSCRLIALP